MRHPCRWLLQEVSATLSPALPSPTLRPPCPGDVLTRPPEPISCGMHRHLCFCLTVYTQIQTDIYVHQHIHYRRALRPTARVLYRSCRRRSRIAHTHNAGGQACKYVDKMHARTCDTCGYINKHVYRHVHSHKQAAHSETRFAPLPARMHRPTHLSRKCVRYQSIVSHARLCVESRLQIVQQCQLHTHDFIKPCRHESILCPRQYRPAGRAPFSCTPPRLLGPHHAHVP